MALVKVGAANMSVTEKIQFARQIVSQMTGNTNFTTPAPTLASITTAAGALETAYNNAQEAYATAKSLTSVQDGDEAALDLLLSQEANYVQNTSGGDQAKIESSGFSVRNIPAGPIGPLPAPTDVDVAPSESAGTVDMDWSPIRGAYTYIVEKAADAPVLTWQPALTTTKSKVVVNTMTSGSKYWFRVSAVGAAGQGPWSDAISKYAP